MGDTMARNDGVCLIACAMLFFAGSAAAQVTSVETDTDLPEIMIGSPQTAGSGEAESDDEGSAGSGAANAVVPGVILSGTAVSDTGTTVLDARSVGMRTDGSGDANTFLRNLPNIQYQNDMSDNAGVDGQSLIDTRPQLLSINGGRGYENNFMLNGVPINNITGPIERSTNPLSDETGAPNIDVVFGLHPQQIYVPSEFLSQATVIDSNASAEYGNFLGGVVMYDLAQPPTDRYRASVSYDRQTERMVNYILGTETGTNPLNRVKPKFEKDNLAVSLGAPITTDLAFIAQASRRTAESYKQKPYTLYDGFLTEDSANNFFRGALSLRTGIGKFTLDSSLTDYTQYWEANTFRDLAIVVEGRSSTTQLEYLGALPSVRVDAIGLENVKLKSRAYYNSSDTENVSEGNTVWNWSGNRRTRNANTGVWTETFNSTLLSDWCRAVPIETLPSTTNQSNTICREGGYADMLQGQNDLGFQAQVTGAILYGGFKVGGEAKSIEGRRARLEDYTLYAVTTVRANPAQIIRCPDDDEACTEEQFASSRNIAPAFDVTETVNAFHGYAELDQTLGWFNIRAGVRVDYEDYFKNVNIAPRLAGTVTPISGFSVTGGYNRYYIGETLYYALRDQQPRAVPVYTRTRNGDGTLSEWRTTQTTGFYGYRDSDVDTPYTDEFTGAVRIREPLLGGDVRLRYLERHSEDRFSSNPCPGVSNCIELSNDAWSFYRSATAEYTKYWPRLDTPFFLNAAGITASVTWSEQNMSRNTYHDNLDDLDGTNGVDNPILYNGQSYHRSSFETVTGNLDIPIRIGATLSTNWFNDLLFFDVSVGYNLGYEGVYDTGFNVLHTDRRLHDLWEDKTFGESLLIDVSGQLNITENAAIEFQVNNVLNKAGNRVATNENPWLLGRNYWVGSKVRF